LGPAKLSVWKHDTFKRCAGEIDADKRNAIVVEILKRVESSTVATFSLGAVDHLPSLVVLHLLPLRSLDEIEDHGEEDGEAAAVFEQFEQGESAESEGRPLDQPIDEKKWSCPAMGGGAHLMPRVRPRVLFGFVDHAGDCNGGMLDITYYYRVAMSESMEKTIACPRCGNRFAWKPSLAGKKISCNCGRIFDVEMGSQSKGEVYQTAPAAGAAAKISDRAALYPKRATTIVADEPQTGYVFSLAKDRLAPVVLIALGIIGRIAQVIFISSRTHHPVAAAAMATFELVSSIAVALLGGYFAAAILAVNFGHLGTAAIKLTTIAIFTSAVAAWVPYVDYDPMRLRGTILAMQLSFLIYFFLFYSLFELDLHESLTTTLLVGVMQGLVMVGMHLAA
jgi:hypothetical protein